MKYVVTGGAGFIGSHLVSKLIESDHEVVVIDDLSTGDRNRLDPKVKFFHSDFADRDTLTKALSDADGVFHLAAFIDLQKSFEFIDECVQTNIQKSIILLNACIKSKIPRFLLSSSSAVYVSEGESRTESPSSPYGSTKLFFEQILKQFSEIHGFSAVCLRYFNVYGSGQKPNSKYAAVIPKFIQYAIQNKPLTVFGDGKQRRDFIHVSDIATANLIAMQNAQGFSVSDVGWGKSFSILELAKALEGIFGKKLDLNFCPRPHGDADDSIAREGDLTVRYGWKPEVDLKDGLREVISSFRA